MAATDTVDRTPSPQMTSADRCLKRFTERITKRKQLSLLELPGYDTAHNGCAPPTFPTRSKRIAVQSIAHILASKRGEYLVKKCLGLTSGISSLSTSAKKACEEIFNCDLAHI